MTSINYNKIQFLKSAASEAGFPKDFGGEVAFAGRSNSGKSSALNAITGISRLARTSKTPGRTQLINFFELDPIININEKTKFRLVDLPGYGYAKVPDAVKHRWRQLIETYITGRESLRGIILLMDIRHPLRILDWQMIKWAVSHDLPIHILLTKADKLTRGGARNVLLGVQKELSGYEDYISIQLFSAVKGTGIIEVHEKLDEWFLEQLK